MSSTNKSFEAVQLMRSIRDQITEETKGMSVEEEIQWLRTAEIGDTFLSRLAEKAARRDATADGTPHRR